MKLKYIGGNSFYDMIYTKGKMYDVEPFEDMLQVYIVISDDGQTYHPFSRLFASTEDACGKCSSVCRSESGKCGLYSET